MQTQKIPRFGEYLTEKGITNNDDINFVLQKQKEIQSRYINNQLGNILLMFDIVREDVLVQQIENYKTDYLINKNTNGAFNTQLTYKSTEEVYPSDEFISKFNNTLFSNMYLDGIIPIEHVGGEIIFYVTTNYKANRLDFYRTALGLPIARVKVYCVLEYSMVNLLKAIGNSLNYDVKRLDNESYTINLHEKVLNMLREACKRGCSDVIIIPSKKTIKVRFKKITYSEVYDAKFCPQNCHEQIIRIILGMANTPDSILSEGAFSCQIGSIFGVNNAWSARVSVVLTVWGFKAVLRLIPNNARILSLVELNLLEDARQYIADKKDMTEGLVLITGHMGNGKNTTAYAIISSWDYDQLDILTIEDPVERFLDGVAQIHVNAKMNFNKIVKEGLRQSIDKAFIGELRDEETVEIAIKNAGSGMFVMSTLHFDRSAQVWQRINALSPGILPKFLTVLRGVVTQRLVNRICTDCRKEIAVNDLSEANRLYLDNTKFYNVHPENPNKFIPEPYKGKLFVGTGKTPEGDICPTCKGRGYNGIAILVETLPTNREFMNKVAKHINSYVDLEYLTDLELEKQKSSFKYQARQLMNNGTVTLDEMRRTQMLDFNVLKQNH